MDEVLMANLPPFYERVFFPTFWVNFWGRLLLSGILIVVVLATMLFITYLIREYQDRKNF